jgi:flavin reductase
MNAPETFVSPADFRAGAQNLAGGVCLITSGTAASRAGFTATAVMSLSDSPPSLAIGIGAGNSSHDAITEAGWLCVNVLASDHRSLADVFAGRTGLRGVDRFAHGSWEASPQGLPVLVDALASFVCRLTARHVHATHSLLVGEVVLMRVGDSRPPLLYWRRDYHSLSAPTP